MSLNKLSTIYTQTFKEVQALFDKDSLEKCFKDLGLQKATCFVFMTDEDLLEINQSSLNHDYFTDVITFDYSDDEDVSHNEICISVARLIDNSQTTKTPLREELHRICIHGMLHLAGHTDDTKDAKNKMTSLENHYLALYCST